MVFLRLLVLLIEMSPPRSKSRKTNDTYQLLRVAFLLLIGSPVSRIINKSSQELIIPSVVINSLLSLCLRWPVVGGLGGLTAGSGTGYFSTPPMHADRIHHYSFLPVSCQSLDGWGLIRIDNLNRNLKCGSHFGQDGFGAQWEIPFVGKIIE